MPVEVRTNICQHQLLTIEIRSQSPASLSDLGWVIMETNEYLKLFILTLCTLKESIIDSRILSHHRIIYTH